MNSTIGKLVLGLILFSLMFSCNSTKSRNEIKQSNSLNYRVALELILENEKDVDNTIQLLNEENSDCYQWKNHIVLFGQSVDSLRIASLISSSGIKANIKYYSNPMYVFDKAFHCTNGEVNVKWKDYLLTANLVDDGRILF